MHLTEPFSALLPSRRPAVLALLLCSTLAAAACSSGGGSVRIVSVTPIVEPPDVALAADADQASSNGEATAKGEALLDAVDPQPTTAEILDQALSWAVEGLERYEAGDVETARQTLSDAQIKLVEAGLPPAMAERGLALLNCCLPAELAHHDVAAVAAQLEAAAEPDAAELAERAAIEREVRRILARFGETAPGDRYLATFLDEVERYIDYYRHRQRPFFERAFHRRHKYQPMIEEVFAASNLPAELSYIALVESGYNPRAVSRADARGLWQFIPATGRRYRLTHRDDFYDARLSTEAAAEYLLDLIGIFGKNSFLLAMAGYNTGEGRIVTCLRRLDDPFDGRNFWEIRDCLAEETRQYVPRVMAAAVIGSDPERYGFHLPSRDQVLAEYDLVTVPRITRLSTLARVAGVEVGELRAANTDLAPTATYTPGRNFPLYLPEGSGETVAAALAVPDGLRDAGGSADDSGERAAGRVGPDGAGATVHRVASGDTLSEIAQQYRLSYRDIAAWNDLTAPYRLRVGQELVIYPGGAGPPPVVYVVRPGNTLQTIAEIFDVRYRDIMAANDLDSPVVRTGQRLRIHPPRRYRSRTYQVRSGDTVARIARRFGVSTREVLTANGLGRRSVIRPGQELVVYVPG